MAATFLVDTSTFSDVMREEPQTTLKLEAAADDPVVFCTIVKGEVLHGISRLSPGRRKATLEAKAAELFARITASLCPKRSGSLLAHPLGV